MSEWTAGGNAVAFDQIGDSIAGTIVYATIEDGTDMKGNPQRKRILDIEDDEGVRHRLYVKPGVMQGELAKRLTENGRENPAVGDRIAVVFESERPSSKPGFHPVKVYSVAYKLGASAPSPSSQGVAASSLI